MEFINLIKIFFCLGCFGFGLILPDLLAIIRLGRATKSDEIDSGYIVFCGGTFCLMSTFIAFVVYA